MTQVFCDQNLLTSYRKSVTINFYHLGHIMARLTSQKAALAVGNIYDLVLIASRRTRELRAGWAPKVESKNGAMVTALREIEQGKVGREYLNKPLNLGRHERAPEDHT
jgi:DNA-directed RNA polymerase subunit omega